MIFIARIICAILYALNRVPPPGHCKTWTMDWTGLDWTGLDWDTAKHGPWTGLDWTGLDCIGLKIELGNEETEIGNGVVSH